MGENRPGFGEFGWKWNGVRGAAVCGLLPKEDGASVRGGAVAAGRRSWVCWIFGRRCCRDAAGLPKFMGGWSEGRSVEAGGEASRFNREEDGAEGEKVELGKWGGGLCASGSSPLVVFLTKKRGRLWAACWLGLERKWGLRVFSGQGKKKAEART